MFFKKFMSYLYDPKGSIRFQMEDWYKTPQSFHEGAVEHLTKEGKVVQTISIVKNLTSNEISTLLIDGKKYRLTKVNSSHLGEVGGIQTAVLIPLD